MDETNLKLVGDHPLSYSNWSAPQYIATSGVSSECELPDWGVFSFESKVSGTELKEEVGEVGEVSDARNSRMRERSPARLVNIRGSNKLFASRARYFTRLALFFRDAKPQYVLPNRYH